MSSLAQRRENLHRSRRLLVFIGAVAFSSSGSGLSVVAVNYYLYVRTHAALSVGLAVLVTFVPPAVVIPALQPLFHQGRLKQLSYLIPLAQAGTTLLLALWTSRDGAVWGIYGFLTLLGCLVQLSWIATYSLLPHLRGLVPPVRANAWLHGASQWGVISAMLAASLIGKIAPPLLIFYDALTFLGIAAAMLWCTRDLKTEALVAQEQGQSSAKGRFRRVLREIAGSRPIAAASWFIAALPLGYVTILIINTALPVLTLRERLLGPRNYTLAEFAFALGAVLTSGLLSQEKMQERRLLVPSLLVLAGGVSALGISTQLFALLPTMVLLGGAVLAVNTSAQNLAQRLVSAPLLPTAQSLGSLVGTAVGAAMVLITAFLLQSGWLLAGLLAIACCILLIASQVRRKVEVLV